MYGLAVIEGICLSGHLSNIDEIITQSWQFLIFSFIVVAKSPFKDSLYLSPNFEEQNTNADTNLQYSLQKFGIHVDNFSQCTGLPIQAYSFAKSLSLQRFIRLLLWYYTFVFVSRSYYSALLEIFPKWNTLHFLIGISSYYSIWNFYLFPSQNISYSGWNFSFHVYRNFTAFCYYQEKKFYETA